jgi:signal transduction histidine kinase
MHTRTSSLIPRWFSPPHLSQPDLRRGAHALWMMSWPFAGVVTLLLGVAVLIEPDTLARRAITVTSVGAIVTALHWLSRTGRPLLASWLMVTALSLLVTQRAWVTGGIHAPVAVFYALFVLMAGVLLGGRGALVTATISVAGSVALTAGSVLELTVAPPGSGPASAALVFAMLAIGLAVVVQSVIAFIVRAQEQHADPVCMLVHDMRSPLHVVMAHLEMLREDVNSESRGDVDGAIAGVARLNRMVNSLVDAGRLEAGRMPVNGSRTDVSRLAASVVEGLRVLQPDRMITLECRGTCTCVCDADLIRRVIDNLVSNAIKHTGRDGRVRVEISGSARLLRIEIQDEGPGVPPEQRERIFEVYTTSATSHQFRGRTTLHGERRLTAIAGEGCPP